MYGIKEEVMDILTFKEAVSETINFCEKCGILHEITHEKYLSYEGYWHWHWIDITQQPIDKTIKEIYMNLQV